MITRGYPWETPILDSANLAPWCRCYITWWCDLYHWENLCWFPGPSRIHEWACLSTLGRSMTLYIDLMHSFIMSWVNQLRFSLTMVNKWSTTIVCFDQPSSSTVPQSFYTAKLGGRWHPPTWTMLRCSNCVSSCTRCPCNPMYVKNIVQQPRYFYMVICSIVTGSWLWSSIADSN